MTRDQGLREEMEGGQGSSARDSGTDYRKTSKQSGARGVEGKAHQVTLGCGRMTAESFERRSL